MPAHERQQREASIHHCFIYSQKYFRRCVFALRNSSVRLAHNNSPEANFIHPTYKYSNRKCCSCHRRILVTCMYSSSRMECNDYSLALEFLLFSIHSKLFVFSQTLKTIFRKLDSSVESLVRILIYANAFCLVVGFANCFS